MTTPSKRAEALKPDEPKILPDGCGYQGYEFGASYPDSQCFGGRLYDMDNCDNDGMIYEPSEDIPCPICRKGEAVKWWNRRGWTLKNAIKLVQNICDNRKNGTEPWKK